MIILLRVFAGNALVAKNAIERCLGRVRDKEFASNYAKYPNSVAFKADDKFYLLVVSSDAYPMARIETRRSGSLILSDSPLKTRNEPLTSFSIVDHNCPYDPKSVIIRSGRLLLKLRVQKQKFKLIGLLENSCGSCGNHVCDRRW